LNENDQTELIKAVYDLKDQRQITQGQKSEVGKASIQNTIDESTQQDIDDDNNLSKGDEEELAQKVSEERQKVSGQLADIGKILANIEEQFKWIELQNGNFDVQLESLETHKKSLLKINLTQDIIKPDYKELLSDLEEQVNEKMK
jgi:hypothetical protein